MTNHHLLLLIYFIFHCKIAFYPHFYFLIHFMLFCAVFHSFFLILILIYYRSRRKARMEQKRIRIRPCISVCQKVEQICPYMLPADRAPAYPTQYAGEPTFFCLGEYILILCIFFMTS